LTWLDLGKKNSVAPQRGGEKVLPPVINTMEWATLLSVLPDLTTFHGIRFFYSTSDLALASMRDIVVSASDRRRLRKNDEIASMLAWKCPKLRRVDHWEQVGGKVIVLVRDMASSVAGSGNTEKKEKVRCEVRRVKV
jgi:hypothetical protein